MTLQLGGLPHAPRALILALTKYGYARSLIVLDHMAQTCWDKCMGSPGNYLSSRETACFENCAKRFLETTQLIMQVTLVYRGFRQQTHVHLSLLSLLRLSGNDIMHLLQVQRFQQKANESGGGGF